MAILLEILEDRYGRRSTIIKSQLPVYADTVLGRVVHNAHHIDLSGCGEISA